MAKIIFLFVIIISLQISAYAFDVVNPIGGRSAAMGRSSVALSDFWSIQNNQAGLSTLTETTAGLYYENRFLMKELGYKCAAVAMPLNWGVIGISVNQFGYSNYNENKFGLAYSREFSPKIRLGLQLDYFLFNYADIYESQHSFTFELGMQSQITDKLCFGIYLFNPARFHLRTINQDELPVLMRIGIQYLLTKNFLFQIEIENNWNDGFNLRAGLEYEIIDKLYVRTGFQTQPSMFTFGLGYEIKFMTIDIAAQMHEIFGSSLQAGIIFNLGCLKK